MATYYVAKSGNDSNAGTSAAAPKLTIASALGVATTSGDVVEIIDEGSYNEGNLWPAAVNLTIRHTASALGRPKIYGTGLGGNDGVRAFQPSYANTTYIGLEISNYSADVFQDSGAGYDKFHMSGCFMHDVPSLGSSAISNSDDTTPTTLKQCIMFFEPSTSTPILNNGYMEISNCLITSSNTAGDWPLLYDYNTHGTASFSTIINRGATDKSTIKFAKVINCIVSSSSGYGIASDDHTYNRVCVSSNPYRNFADGADNSQGTGDRTASPTNLAFVDGDSIGSTNSIIANYKIREESTAVDNGITFDSIAVDLTGTVRPQDGSFDIGAFEFVASDPDWTEYTTQPRDNRQSDFTLNTYTNLTSNQKFRYTTDPKQAPFSRGSKGPSSLRGRTTPYKTTK